MNSGQVLEFHTIFQVSRGAADGNLLDFEYHSVELVYPTAHGQDSYPEHHTSPVLSTGTAGSGLSGSTATGNSDYYCLSDPTELLRPSQMVYSGDTAGRLDSIRLTSSGRRDSLIKLIIE